ncbi:MAG: helix-turn-helix domain-containing protein [Pseudomonadota bacterium]
MVSLWDTIAALPREEQDAVAAESARLKAEYLTLQDLRKARQLTQVELAKTLGKSQASIANLEKRSDVLLSTLRSYVEALGGELALVARFPDRPPVTIDRLATEDEGQKPHPER